MTTENLTYLGKDHRARHSVSLTFGTYLVRPETCAFGKRLRAMGRCSG